MAHKVFPVITCMLLLLSLFCEAVPSDAESSEPKAFKFLEHLNGSRKGVTIKGVHQLKQYLLRFGYIDQNVTNDDDDFDNALETAIKTYQLNYHLNRTGTLDSETLEMMMTPRCGVADIVNGTTTMLSGMESQDDHDHDSSTFHIVSHYSFFPGKPKWGKFRLTYAFHSNIPSTAFAPVGRAFSRWASVSRFRFRRIRNYNNADLKIGMFRRAHGDGNPFDGRGGTLAHAFAPRNGRFHYDRDERWSTNLASGTYDYQTLALHEIGHLLGLGHSSVQGAIMFPTFRSGVRKGLHQDDIRGIRALYR